MQRPVKGPWWGSGSVSYRYIRRSAGSQGRLKIGHEYATSRWRAVGGLSEVRWLHPRRIQNLFDKSALQSSEDCRRTTGQFSDRPSTWPSDVRRRTDQIYYGGRGEAMAQLGIRRIAPGSSEALKYCGH